MYRLFREECFYEQKKLNFASYNTSHGKTTSLPYLIVWVVILQIIFPPVYFNELQISDWKIIKTKFVKQSKAKSFHLQ